MAVAIMQFSTQRITAPWLAPTTAQRIAGMLNYFLEHLTGAALGPTAPLTGSAATCGCRHAGMLTCFLEHLTDAALGPTAPPDLPDLECSHMQLRACSLASCSHNCLQPQLPHRCWPAQSPAAGLQGASGWCTA